MSEWMMTGRGGARQNAEKNGEGWAHMGGCVCCVSICLLYNKKKVAYIWQDNKRQVILFLQCVCVRTRACVCVCVCVCVCACVCVLVRLSIYARVCCVRLHLCVLACSEVFTDGVTCGGCTL